MPKKEDRSGWVAVEPEFQRGDGDDDDGATTMKIAKARSAYQFFQKDASKEIKSEGDNDGTAFDLGEYSRRVRKRWEELGTEERARYERLAAQDKARFARESHLADVAALERRERLQKERYELLLDDDEIGDDDEEEEDEEGGAKRRRTTRRKWERKQKKAQKLKAREERKKAKLLRKEEKKKQKPKKKKKKIGSENGGDEDDDDYSPSANDNDGDESVSSASYESSSSFESSSSSLSDSDDDDDKPARVKKPRVFTQKQLEYRQKQQREKADKEAYITERQDDLRKQRAASAKRRLEFLLKQSNIFEHFGSVKEDTARYGLKSQQSSGSVGNDEVGTKSDDDDKLMLDERQREELEEADEHEATYLTAQPSTLAHGQMRPYQLEGLNWMIRLQENGVNGILADEMGLGKTLQTISILVYMLEYQEKNGPHLILVPKSTLSNWMNEIARWAPTLKAIRFHGDKATREAMVRDVLEPAMRDEDRDWHVCVTTYEVCNIEKTTLSKFAWSYLIIGT